MRKKLIFIFLTLANVLTATSPHRKNPRDYNPPSSVPHSSWLFTVNIPHLQKKFRHSSPQWMKQRIQQEFAPFESKKISLRSIEETFKQANATAHNLTRYRIIDRKVYRKGSDPYGIDCFFRTIARCADYPGIPDIPNIDFIWNHDDATPLHHQPQDFWITRDPKNQAPIFTYARIEEGPYLISIPDRFTLNEWHELSQKIRNANGDFPWERKKKSALWRGQPNDWARLGLGHVDLNTVTKYYSLQPRYQICELSTRHPDLLDAGFNAPGFSATPTLEQFITPLMRMGMSPDAHLQWAYLPTVDGYTSTYPGYLWRLLSNSIAFKQESEDSQWFYDALEPYVHYIPISQHMEDLIEKILWAQQNDTLCKQIAQQATQFVTQNLMMEDIYRYFFEVFLKYADCQEFNTGPLLKETEANPEWIRIR